MLQTIREHTHGWIAGTIISIIILSFALWGIHSYFQGNSGATVVAVVNGTDITTEEYKSAYERLRRQAQSQLGAASLKEDAQLKKRALSALIDLNVLKQASIKQGFYISSGQIDNYLQSMPEFQVDGQFSLDKFQEILSLTLMSPSEFLDLINTSLLIDQPKLGIILTSFALPSETKYTMSLVNQERDIAYMIIPSQHFQNEPLSISPEKIKAYYESNKNDFMTPEQVSVEYVELNYKDVADTFSPDEASLKTFYQENVNSYTQAPAWKLADIIVPIPENADQAAINQAQQNANAAGLAAKSGQDFTVVGIPYQSQQFAKQGFMILNQVPVDLQQTVAVMTKPGAVSDPIKTDKGFVILKVVDYREPKVLTFDEAKEKVKSSYIRLRAEEKYAKLRDQLSDVTYENPGDLTVASKTLNLPIKSTELFQKVKAGSGIAQSQKVRDVAFSNDVLSLQNNSDVIQIDPETAVVIRVKSHLPAALQPLSTVNKQIEDRLRAHEATMRTKQFAEKMQEKLKAGEDPQKLAIDNKLEWHQAGLIGRYAKNMDAAIVEAAFSLPNNIKKEGKSEYGITRLPNGFAIIALKSVKNGVDNDSQKQSVFAEQVQNSEGLLEYGLYKQSQLNKAKIEILQ